MNPSSTLPSLPKDDRYIKHSSYHYPQRERSRDREHYSHRHQEDYDYTHHDSSMKYYERSYDKKKLNCFILLPKNYYNYISKNFNGLCSDLRKEIKDISDIQYDYTLPHFQEYILKLVTYKIESNALAIKIICDYLFKEMKNTFKTMTYLKVSILVPDNVVGFVIGIDGKNINTIRAETDAKIEVFPPNESKRYRKIEISGNPHSISAAAERIYCISYKYINFGKDSRYPERDRKPRRYSRSPSEGYKRREREEGMISEERPYRKRNEYKPYRERYQREERTIDSRRRHNSDNRHYDDIANVSSNQYIPNNDNDKNEVNNIISSEPELPIEEQNEQNNDVVIEINDQEEKSPSSDNKSDFASKIKSSSPSDQLKSNIDLIVSMESIEALKLYQNNIWLELENTYHCSVSKKTVTVSEKEMNVITFTGTPEENSLAIYHLQKLLTSSTNSK